MNRSRKEDKRAALLQAAISVIAERGLSAAPTSAISAAAGVAEGTLFTYFATKHDLANALYLEIKQRIAHELFADAPTDGDVRTLIRHHWDCFVRWGVAEPQSLRVLDQLTASGIITAETAAEGNAAFASLETMVKNATREGTLRKMPLTLLSSTFEALVQNTIRQIAAGNGAPATVRRMGFEMLWRAIATDGA